MMPFKYEFLISSIHHQEIIPKGKDILKIFILNELPHGRLSDEQKTSFDQLFQEFSFIKKISNNMIKKYIIFLILMFYEFMILNGKIPHSKNSQDFILLVE